MHKSALIVLLLPLLLSSAGCTSRYQTRGIEPPLAYAIPLDSLDTNPVTTCQSRRDLEARSIETFKDRSEADSRTDGFDIGVVEVNDAGEINLAQRDLVFDRLRKTVADQTDASNGLLLVVFIHGWHHSAQVCDYNLACFRRVLYGLKKLPQLQDRNVMGLYIGWRGDSAKGEATGAFTLWNRKEAAEHIGKTGVKELLLDLDALNDELRQTSQRTSDEPVTMVSIGHSLGGAMLFSAAREKMVGHLNEAEYIRMEEGQRDLDPSQTKALRAGLGDLVVLLNPAIEATRWEVFEHDQHLPGHYQAGKQFPIIVALASEADDAVGRAFPASRWLQVLWKPWEIFSKDEIDAKGVGHYKPQVTHHLCVNNPLPLQITQNHPYTCTDLNQALPDEKGESCGCPSNTFAQHIRFDISKFDLNAAGAQSIPSTTPGYQTALELVPVNGGHDRHSPYFLIRTGPEVMADHNDIYNEYLVTFLTAFLNDYIIKNKASYVEQRAEQRR